MVLSVYLGEESITHKNTVIPEPSMFNLSLILLLMWVGAIFSGVILSFTLSCDSCGIKFYKILHGYVSLKRRNWFVLFFYPDDMYEKKLKCSNCDTEYDLA